MIKTAIPVLILALASLASAQTTIPNGQGQYCGYLLHGPYVAPTTSCQAPIAGGSIALSNFYAGSFSDPIYAGYPPPTFSLYSSTGGLECSGAMSGTYADGQVTASFSGTCTDGSLFSGTTVQQIATLIHSEGGGRGGTRRVTSYLITSGSTIVS